MCIRMSVCGRVPASADAHGSQRHQVLKLDLQGL